MDSFAKDRRESVGEYIDSYIEDTVKVSARYAGSRVADLISTLNSGVSERRIRGETATYSAVSRPLPDAAEYFGESPRPEESAAQATSMLRQLLASADESARNLDPRIVQVLIDGELTQRRIAMVTPEEVIVDRRDLAYLTIRVVAEQNGTIATGFITPATTHQDLALDAAAAGAMAAERALVGLSARPAPVRHMPVVVGPGRGTVLIHEACCHPLEGDEVSRGSIYADRLGELIAARGLSIADDATIPGAAGSYARDDDGTPAASTTLVEDGRLASFLTDLVTARRLGLDPTGNGRRESFRHPCLPRMSNTRVLPGHTDPADVISSTDFGIYALHVGGGEVVESTGDFVFRVLNGYLIEGGRITDPVKETTIRGNGAEVLKMIDAVGNDPMTGAAKCGKFGQGVAVGVAGPTLRIGSLLVGGTAA